MSAAVLAPSPYAIALADLVLDQKNQSELIDQIKAMAEIFKDNQDYLTLLDHPGLEKEEKKAFIQKAFITLEPLLELFLSMLIEDQVIKDADTILEQAMEQIDEANGILTALVESPIALTREEKERLQKVLEKRFEARIKIKESLNPELIGGIRVSVGEKVIDHSIAHQLEGMRRSLKEYADETQPS